MSYPGKRCLLCWHLWHHIPLARKSRVEPWSELASGIQSHLVSGVKLEKLWFLPPGFEEHKVFWEARLQAWFLLPWDPRMDGNRISGCYLETKQSCQLSCKVEKRIQAGWLGGIVRLGLFWGSCWGLAGWYCGIQQFWAKTTGEGTRSQNYGLVSSCHRWWQMNLRCLKLGRCTGCSLLVLLGANTEVREWTALSFSWYRIWGRVRKGDGEDILCVHGELFSSTLLFTPQSTCCDFNKKNISPNLIVWTLGPHLVTVVW